MNWLAAIGIHLLPPLLGIGGFALLCRRMQQTRVPNPPFISYSLLFGILGGWLLVFLTALFWSWSGMASLGVFFLMLVAPFLTAGIAFVLRNRRSLSLFHRTAYFTGIAYSGLAWTVLLWVGFVRP